MEQQLRGRRLFRLSCTPQSERSPFARAIAAAWAHSLAIALESPMVFNHDFTGDGCASRVVQASCEVHRKRKKTGAQNLDACSARLFADGML